MLVTVDFTYLLQNVDANADDRLSDGEESQDEDGNIYRADSSSDEEPLVPGHAVPPPPPPPPPPAPAGRPAAAVGSATPRQPRPRAHTPSPPSDHVSPTPSPSSQPVPPPPSKKKMRKRRASFALVPAASQSPPKVTRRSHTAVPPQTQPPNTAQPKPPKKRRSGFMHDLLTQGPDGEGNLFSGSKEEWDAAIAMCINEGSGTYHIVFTSSNPVTTFNA